ncbi:UNVERIFIED_CONTAM: hypothetical protein NCL1_20623 [Trichonephila clavipes]
MAHRSRQWAVGPKCSTPAATEQQLSLREHPLYTEQCVHYTTQREDTSSNERARPLHRTSSLLYTDSTDAEILISHGREAIQTEKKSKRFTIINQDIKLLLILSAEVVLFHIILHSFNDGVVKETFIEEIHHPLDKTKSDCPDILRNENCLCLNTSKDSGEPCTPQSESPESPRYNSTPSGSTGSCLSVYHEKTSIRSLAGGKNQSFALQKNVLISNTKV